MPHPTSANRVLICAENLLHITLKHGGDHASRFIYMFVAFNPCVIGPLESLGNNLVNQYPRNKQFAPENRPSQEESSLPTIGFSWLFSRFREGRLHRNGDYHSAFDHCLNLCCAWALPCRNPCLNPLSFWCVFESVTGRCGELHEARINSEVYEILCMLLRTL